MPIDKCKDVDMLFEGARCRRLWVSVIEQAILDANYTKGSSRAQNARDLKEWLEGEEFIQVMEWAGLAGSVARFSALIKAELEKSEKRVKRAPGKRKNLVRRYTESQRIKQK